MERKLWLDWMKVIGMFSIILGHLFPTGLVPFLYSFSVPLFFIISGFLTNINRDNKRTWPKLCNGLLIPYVLIWLVNVVVYAGISRSIPSDIINKFVGCLFGLQQYIGAMWFVYTLIICKLIVSLIGKIDRKHAIKMVIGIQLVCIAGLFYINHCDLNDLLSPISNVWPDLSIMFNGKIVWSWTNTLCAMPYFCAGILLREFNVLNSVIKKLSQVRPIYLIFIALIAFGVLYPLSEINGNMFMYECGYGNYLLLHYFNAFLGSFAVLTISLIIQNHFSYFNYWINLLASGSILVLGFHGIPLNITMLKFPTLISIGGEIFGSLMYTFLLYITFIPIIIFVNKYCPIFSGYRSKNDFVRPIYPNQTAI